MFTADAKKAISANAEWLAGLRLIDWGERLLIRLAIVLALPLFVVSALLTTAGLLASVAGSLAHIGFAMCVFHGAPRHLSRTLSVLVILSQVNLLVYVWSEGPHLATVMYTYNAVLLTAALLTVSAKKAAAKQISKLRPDSDHGSFQWLVTSAPLSLRAALRTLVLENRNRRP